MHLQESYDHLIAYNKRAKIQLLRELDFFLLLVTLKIIIAMNE